uniref:CGG triplet repeat-binding protein 1 n=1 Tax=Sphenodon punctatus TaxID=8508 RepID=A0A8D0G6Y2_SPHPU
MEVSAKDVQKKNSLVETTPVTKPTTKTVTAESRKKTEPFVKKNSSHKALKVTAQERATEFAKELHEDGGKLFCTSCNVMLDHTRRSIVVDHIKCKTHLKRKAEFEQRNDNNRQRTITSSIQCHTDTQMSRIEVTQEFVKMCLEAKIPLEKADHPSV